MFSYQTPKFIEIRHPWLVCVYWFLWAAILAYVVVYTIVIKKSYQEYDELVSGSMLKVKGSAYTQGPNASRVLYDAIDLVVPPMIPNAQFITSSIAFTPNQKRSICEGNDPSLELCNCTKGTIEACCRAGTFTSNGAKTGRCGASGKFCEVEAWCPLEDDSKLQTFDNVANWTVMVRINVRFPKFHVGRTNQGAKLEMGKNLFTIADVVNRTGWDWDSVKKKGALIVMDFDYDCDLNRALSKCEPDLNFHRLDLVKQGSVPISSGFNFRYFQKQYGPNGEESRYVTKASSIAIIVTISGQAGKFNIVNMSIALGAGVALLGVATVICDLILQYIMPGRKRYMAVKYEPVSHEEKQPLMQDPAEGSEQEAGQGAH